MLQVITLRDVCARGILIRTSRHDWRAVNELNDFCKKFKESEALGGPCSEKFLLDEYQDF